MRILMDIFASWDEQFFYCYKNLHMTSFLLWKYIGKFLMDCILFLNIRPYYENSLKNSKFLSF